MYQGQPTEYAYSLVGVESVPSCDNQHCTMANAYPLDQLGGIVARFRPRLIKTNELPGRLVAWLVTMDPLETDPEDRSSVATGAQIDPELAWSN